MSEQNQEKNFSALSDSHLTDFIKCGSDLAFEEIVRRYRGLIGMLSSEYCTGEYDPCDFSQEGLLALLNACKTFDEKNGASFKNYAALCIKRRFISIARKSNAKGSIPEESLVSLDNAELEGKSLQSPEELVVSKERLQELLVQMKNNLTQKEISVVYLYLKGLSYEEIAKETGLNKKAVDNALQRVKKKLRN